MAKKHEFKPDKPQSSLISHLLLTGKQQKVCLKWGLYLGVLLVLSVLQDVLLCHVRVMGATTELVPCGIFLICILEGSENGSVFALVASALYLFTGTAHGPYALVAITALAVLLCIFRQAFLQQGFSSTLICTAAAMILFELIMFALGLFLGLTHWRRVWGFLITAGLSLIAVPVLYPVCKAIGAIGGEVWKE
ncbi:MAG: hypothetical protein IJB47_00680 [Oscillospiraceae bacterium]|nr:hypothetical protein [Oscillospiraceae bacterium]